MLNISDYGDNICPMPVPPFNVDGFLPPNDPSGPVSRNRSPYKCSVLEVCEAMATSKERVKILLGWLNLREDLSKCGHLGGFQWLDGSFVQDIESQEARPPNDLDVISFVSTDGTQQFEENVKNQYPTLISPSSKSAYLTDHFIQIDQYTGVEDFCYWFSLFSHTRDNVWKGIIEVELDVSNDKLALDYIASLQEDAK